MYIHHALDRRRAFTLVEMLVVIAIILALSALAAAFMPRVSDSQNLSRAVDQLEQWLLTAKMRAKRDGLATGIRFIGSSTGSSNLYSEFQYIQQPEPLSGGTSLGAVSGTPTFSGGYCLSAVALNPATAGTTVTFGNVDFSLGGTVQSNAWLVQQGDYLELRNGGGVHYISSVPSIALQPLPYFSVVVSPAQPIVLAAPTANYRILRQPRLLTGENPLMLPNNFAVDTGLIPSTVLPGNTTINWSNVSGPSGVPEILFSPTGAVIGGNASNGKVLLSVYDTTMDPFDISRVGIIAIQCRTGYIGAYSMAQGTDPFYFAETGRESGL